MARPPLIQTLLTNITPNNSINMKYILTVLVSFKPVSIYQGKSYPLLKPHSESVKYKNITMMVLLKKYLNKDLLGLQQ